MKGRVIKYKPVAKLSGKSSSKKGGMNGGFNEPIFSYEYRCSVEVRNDNFRKIEWEKILSEQDKKLKEFCKNEDTKGIFKFFDDVDYEMNDMISGRTGISFVDYKEAKKTYEYDEIIERLIVLIKNIKKSFDEFGSIPYDEFVIVKPEHNKFSNNSNNSNRPNSSNSSNKKNISEYSYKEFLTYLHQKLEKE